MKSSWRSVAGKIPLIESVIASTSLKSTVPRHAHGRGLNRGRARLSPNVVGHRAGSKISSCARRISRWRSRAASMCARWLGCGSPGLTHNRSGRSFQNVGYDFHVPVRVRAKAFAGFDTILVHHTQRSKRHVLWILIVTKRKRVIRVEPSVVEMASVFGFSDLDHDCTFLSG